MTKLVVISNESQLNLWIRSGLLQTDNSLTITICDNPIMHARLNREHISFYPLDDFFLHNEWEEINSWGCDRAANWASLYKSVNSSSIIDLGSALYYHLCYSIIAILTNYRYAVELLNKFTPSKVYTFESSEKPGFPQIEGNLYLNAFFHDLSAQAKITVETIPSDHTMATNRTRSSQQFLNNSNVKHGFKRIINETYSFAKKTGGKIDLLCDGSLAHLAGVMLSLKQRNKSVALYSENLNFEMLDFANRNGISYLTKSCFPKKDVIQKETIKQNYEKALLQAFDAALDNRIFIYRDFDLGRYIKSFIFDQLDTYLSDVCDRANHYENVVNFCNPSAALLDEDVSTRRSFLAAFFKAKSIKIFCISHAHYPVDFSVRKENRIYRLSTTFVNSEYEKSLYETRGWDGERLIVSGTPRFDGIANCHQPAIANSRVETKTDFKLLLSAASLAFQRPQDAKHLGNHIACQGNIQIPTVKAVIEATKDLPIHLVLKPHIREEFHQWEKIVSREKAKRFKKVTVTKPSERFAELLKRCDAMILSYWSTSIVEAVLCDKPVILFDMFDTLRDSAPQIQLGYCQIVRDIDSLRKQFVSLVERKIGGSNFVKVTEKKSFNYYFGEQDGENTNRVTRYICNALT